MIARTMLVWWLLVWPDLTASDPRPYFVGPPHLTQAACDQIVTAFLASPAQWARHATCVRDPRGGR